MQNNLGIISTGDHAEIYSRTIIMGARAIPNPEDVDAPEGTGNLPRPQVQLFVGRDSDLDQLRDALGQDASAVVRQVIYGLGGVGKSELALQYATDHRGDYTLVWWITAEGESEIQAGLADLADRLCPQLAETSADRVEWATTWLQAHNGWLLILDNVRNREDVQELLGQLTGGRILITTRRDIGWGQIADQICLDVLDPGPAAELLTTRTGQHAPPDREAAEVIAAELGYLPLALDQAAAYIRETTRITLAAYLQRLRQHPATMYLAQDEAAQQTIARVWDITFRAIRKKDADAMQLLRILAWYAPDGVPRRILGGKAKTTKRQEALDKQLGLLASYSMITLTEQTVSMHRLVQAVLRQPPGGGPIPTAFNWLGTKSMWLMDVLFVSPSRLSIALNWLHNAIPKKPAAEVDDWQLLRALPPQADNFARLSLSRTQRERLAWIQYQLGHFQRSQAQYQEALALHKAALKNYKAVRGDTHRHIATVLGELAATYLDLGRTNEALPLQEQAVQITAKARGSEPADRAALLSNLAVIYNDLGRDAEALPLQRQALQIIFENVRRPDPEDTSIQLANLAATYLKLGLTDEALSWQQRALRISEKGLGPDHLTTGFQLGRLASFYRELGRTDEALSLQRQALQISEEKAGSDHLTTGLQLENLAAVYTDLGRFAEALPLERRALQITEEALGPNHRTTKVRRDNLAAIYSHLGRTDEAQALR